MTARKDFSFDPQSPYVVHLSASVNQGSNPLVPTVQWAGARDALHVIHGGPAKCRAADFLPRRDVTRVTPKDIGTVDSEQGAFGLVAWTTTISWRASVLPKQVPLRLHYESVASRHPRITLPRRPT